MSKRSTLPLPSDPSEAPLPNGISLAAGASAGVDPGADPTDHGRTAPGEAALAVDPAPAAPTTGASPALDAPAHVVTNDAALDAAPPDAAPTADAAPPDAAPTADAAPDAIAAAAPTADAAPDATSDAAASGDAVPDAISDATASDARPDAPRASAETPSSRPRLADRVPRHVSAKEALRRAVEAERAREARAEAARAAEVNARPDRSAASTSGQGPATPAAPRNDPAPASSRPRGVKPALDPLGDVEIVRILPVGDRAAFRAVWTALRPRALAVGDLAEVALASVLLDAATRVPEDRLVALELTVGGTPKAAWVDADRGVLLGIAGPPALYLAGL